MPEQQNRAYIEPDIVSGLHHAAAEPKESSRPVLQGIALTKEGNLVAASGFILAIRIPKKTDGITFDGPPFAAILPPQVAKVKLEKNCSVIVDNIAHTVTFTPHKGDETTVRLMDGHFPDYSRLVPTIAPGDTNALGTFNPELLIRLHKAIGSPDVMRLWAKSKRDPAVTVSSASDAYTALGLIMPMFCEEQSTEELIAAIQPFLSPAPLQESPASKAA
jgi:hypothetical protein